LVVGLKNLAYIPCINFFSFIFFLVFFRIYALGLW